MQSLYTGLTGIQAANTWLDRIGNNLANLQTVGFAQDQPSFADALTMQLYGNATDPTSATRTTPPGWRGGTGVVSGSEGRDFAGMSMQPTGNPMNVAIQGTGFLAVKGPQGTMYTRDGNFQWSKNANGQFELTTDNGNPVLSTSGQPIVKPSGAASMAIGTDGQISFDGKQGPKLAIVEIGEPSSHLIAQGNNLYSLAPGGQVRLSTTSTVQQGYELMSNVDESQQMANMIQAQNMFQMNAESVSMANQMMGIANTIRQGGN